MKIMIATDIHIHNVDDKFYTVTQIYHILKRYYESFGKLVIVSRKSNKVLDDLNNKFEFTEMVDGTVFYSNILDVNSWHVKKQIEEKMKECDIVIGRLHSFSGIVCHKIAKKLNKPYYSEVMADAWDATWNHSLKGKIVAPYMYLSTKKVVKNSDYALYVTKEYLQKKYPCKGKTIGISNVKISDISQDILEKRINKIENLDFSKELILTTTAAVNVRYKGQQFVIRAIPALNKLGIKVKYRLIGGGDNTYLLNLAKKLSVENQVEFVGRKPLDEVFKLLDETDIYIQPSLQEGLPRSVVEAMSRGCPALGARTAGIPELIANECVFKRKSPNAIVKTIQKIVNKEKFIELAIQNFNESKNYVETVLDKKRVEFYERVKSEIEKK